MKAKAGKEAVATKQPGVRELSKRATQAKIILAARQLFADSGYDGATMRQIAAHAGLGLGTLSNYVTVKRDLIYLIFNEEVESLTDKALASPRRSQSFVKKLLIITEPHYRLFAKEPILSRILLSEILQHSPGMHLERYLLIRDRLIHGIELIVIDAQQKGEIQSNESSGLIALNIFFSFSAAARWFLAAPDPDWRDGQRICERILKLMVVGLHPPREKKRTGPSKPKPRRKLA